LLHRILSGCLFARSATGLAQGLKFSRILQCNYTPTLVPMDTSQLARTKLQVPGVLPWALSQALLSSSSENYPDQRPHHTTASLSSPGGYVISCATAVKLTTVPGADNSPFTGWSRHRRPHRRWPPPSAVVNASVTPSLSRMRSQNA
jgi:hypothetical protein